MHFFELSRIYEDQERLVGDVSHGLICPNMTKQDERRQKASLRWKFDTGGPAKFDVLYSVWLGSVCSQLKKEMCFGGWSISHPRALFKSLIHMTCEFLRSNHLIFLGVYPSASSKVKRIILRQVANHRQG